MTPQKACAWSFSVVLLGVVPASAEQLPLGEDAAAGALGAGDARAPADPSAAPETDGGSGRRPRAARGSGSGEPERLVVLFTSDLGASLVDPGCGPGGEALLPRIAAAVRAERALAARTGGHGVVLLDAGDALFPSPLVRDLAARRSSARALVEALGSAGYDAMAIGNRPVSAPFGAFSGFAAAARRVGLPLLLSNVRCAEAEGDGPEVCGSSLAGLSRRRAIVERGRVRVGVFSLLPEEIAGRVARQNVRGTTFDPPVDAARAVTRALREEGADLVVLLSHVDSSATAPRRTLQILSRLDRAEAPDLVISASTAGLAIRIRTADSGPAVLAVAGGALGRAVLERTEGEGFRLVGARAVALPSVGDPVLGAVVGSWRAAFCAEQARSLSGGSLASSMGLRDFIELLVRLARLQTRADIALLNRGMVAPRAFPMEGEVTAASIRRALPFDSELRVATLRGEHLLKLAPRLLAASGATVVGLAKRESTYQVNGRTLLAEASYRIVTNDFLAEGGDGLLLESDALAFEPARGDGAGNVVLADRLVRWLELRGEEPLDPEERVDLYTRPLWHGGFALELSVSDTHVQDRAGYDQPQLRRQELLNLRVGLEARGGMSTRDHSWDTLFQLRYGRQRLETEVGSDEHEWGESADLVNLRSSYTMDHIRNHLLEGAWYGPSVYAEYNLESELQHEGDGPHFLEMTGTAGLRLKPLSWLQLQLGAGVRSRVLEDDARAVPGLTARAEVARRRFFPTLRSPIFLAGLVDYFLSWPGEGEAHKLIAEGRLEVELLGPLRLSASLRLFLYEEPGLPVATAVDSTLGLTVAMTHRLQTY